MTWTRSCLNTDPSDPNSYLNNPGWLQLESTYKWVLDWGESANFVPKTVARNILTLIQMAEGDHTMMPNLVTRKAAEAYQAVRLKLNRPLGQMATAQKSMIPKSFLLYSDVEGQRQYEHDTLNRACLRLVLSVYILTQARRVPDADHAKFQEWVAGNSALPPG